MKKHDIFGIILWSTILAVLVYNIGMINTIIIFLALIVGSLLYMGVP